MSVIGRLDEQVDAVLIETLKRRPESEAHTAVAPPPSLPTVPTLEEVRKEQDESNADLPLPVWLL